MKLPINLTIALLLAITGCVALKPPQRWLDSGEKEKNTVQPVIVRRVEKVTRLTWEDALRKARERNPTIAAAAQRIAIAEARVREAQSLAFPTLDARGNYVRFMEAANFRGRTGSNVGGNTTRTRFFTGRGSDIYTAGLDLSYPVFDGGDAYYAREAAESSQTAAERDAEVVRRLLDLRTSEAFLNILLSRGATQIAQESLDFTRGEEGRAAARAEAGEGLRVDALRFATRASEEQLALNRALANRRVRIAILAELLDVEFAEEAEFVIPNESYDLPEGDLLEVALANRPELKFFRARIEEVDHLVGRESATWWPTISAFGSYGFITLDTIKLSDANDELQVGANASMNLFEGGRTLARLSALHAEKGVLRSEQKEVGLEIEREVREAQIELDVSRENVAVSCETERLADEVLDRVTARYRAGNAQVLDVTESQLQKTRARLGLLRSRVNHVLAQVRLNHALGLKVLRGRQP